MELNIYNSLILAGITQGFIFSIWVLSFKKNRSTSIYFLVSLILALSFSNLQNFLMDIQVVSVSQFYLYVFLPWATLLPALIYCFTTTTVQNFRKINSVEKLLFLPFLIFLLLTFVYRIGRVLEYDNESFYDFFNACLNSIEIIGVLLMLLVLVILSFKVFRSKKGQEKIIFENIQINFTWLKLTLFLIGILSVYWGYLTYRNIFNRETFTSFYLLWIGMSFLIYWLGYIGVYKYGINEDRKKIRKLTKDASVIYEKKSSKNEHVIALERLLVEDKMYLNPSLTLERIADKLQLSTSYLSRILNAELGMGFTDYLNSLRVMQAKEYLMNPEFSKYTIIAIGLEAGFNSKSAFFNVFKKSTGKTPLEFKRDFLTS